MLDQRTRANLPVLPDSLPEFKEAAIEFDNVSRQYRLHHEAKLTLQDRVVNIFKKKNTSEDFWALKDVSFRLEKGRTLGIIGQNGAGKSTLLKLATRILEPTAGVIRVNGRVSAMLELGTGFHPELSARDNIYLNGAFYGLDRKAMDERYDQIVEFSELGKFIDTPVKHFSSGMYMRLGFAVAITVSPDILIIDEVLAVGDAAFSRKCHRAIEDLKNQSKAMVFVSHSPGEISRFCDEVMYLSHGKVVNYGKPGDVIDEYLTDSMGKQYFTSKLETNQKAALATKKPGPAASVPSTPEPPTSPAMTPVKSVVASGVNPIDREYAAHFKIWPGVMHPTYGRQFTFPKLWAALADSSTDEADGQDSKNKFRRSDYLPTEYYLAVINSLEQSARFEMIGYKRSGGVFDQAVGAMRVVPMGSFEIGPQQMEIYKLEEGALMYTNLLWINAEQPLVFELVEYEVISKQTEPEPQPALSVNPSQSWFYPFCDIRGQNRCYFEIFNPHSQPVDIVMTLYRNWGGMLFGIRSYQCAPNSLLRIDLNEELAAGDGEQRPGEKFYGGVLFQTSLATVSRRYSLQLESPQFHLQENLELTAGITSAR